MDSIVNIAEKFGQFDSHWDPKVIGELNGQMVKIAKVKGDFLWHSHENEDELFMVIKGKLILEFRDKVVEVNEGEMYIVPKGKEHRPRAQEETHILMMEPNTTVNTGKVKSAYTKTELDKI